MTDTTFVNGTTITPEWCNAINQGVYKGLGGSGSKSAATAYLGIDSLVAEVANLSTKVVALENLVLGYSKDLGSKDAYPYNISLDSTRLYRSQINNSPAGLFSPSLNANALNNSWEITHIIENRSSKVLTIVKDHTDTIRLGYNTDSIPLGFSLVKFSFFGNSLIVTVYPITEAV